MAVMVTSSAMAVIPATSATITITITTTTITAADTVAATDLTAVGTAAATEPTAAATDPTAAATDPTAVGTAAATDPTAVGTAAATDLTAVGTATTATKLHKHKKKSPFIHFFDNKFYVGSEVTQETCFFYFTRRNYRELSEDVCVLSMNYRLSSTTCFNCIGDGLLDITLHNLQTSHILI